MSGPEYMTIDRYDAHALAVTENGDVETETLKQMMDRRMCSYVREMGTDDRFHVDDFKLTQDGIRALFRYIFSVDRSL